MKELSCWGRGSGGDYAFFLLYSEVRENKKGKEKRRRSVFYDGFGERQRKEEERCDDTVLTTQT